MRNRVVSFEHVDPAELVDHPDNWREHPNTQRAALREVISKVGIADVILAYRSPSTKKLTIVDGHLRREVLGGQEKVPVAVLDLDDDEAKALLASHDPVGAMAQRNDDLFEELLASVEEAGYADIARMLDTDGWTPEDGPEAAAAFEADTPAEYPIAPLYDEGYDALIVTTATEAEWNQLKTLLDIPQARDRRGRVGTTHVLTFEEFMQRWHAPAGNDEPAARPKRRSRKTAK